MKAQIVTPQVFSRFRYRDSCSGEEVRQVCLQLQRAR